MRRAAGAQWIGENDLLLHGLNGLLRGESRIEICGIELRAESLSEIRRRVGIVFQEVRGATVHADRPPGRDVRPAERGLPVGEARDKAVHALSMVGMAHVADKAPYHLSAGRSGKWLSPACLPRHPKF